MIKLIKPYISYEEVEKDFKDIFESGWFTKGKNVNKFRESLCSYTGSSYSVLTTSATTALWTCLKVLGIKEGDEVIVSDFSFPATVNVVEDIGATPIFVDVDIDTYNMSYIDLKSKITSKTKAVIFVDAFGNPSGIDKVQKLREKYEVPLIEDAACAIGSSINGIKIGNFSDFTCFSFHPRKLLTTGEGGAITTKKLEYSDSIDIKLNHGASVSNGKFDFVDCGYNFRMSELQAVMGVKQLEKLDDIVLERNKIKDEFEKRLNQYGFRFQQLSDDTIIHNIQSLVVILPENINRDELILKLKDKGIETTLGTYCLSGLSFYRKKYNDVQNNSDFLEKHTLTLPCYDGVDIEYICDIIGQYM